MNKHALNKLGFLLLTGADSSRIIFKASEVTLFYRDSRATHIFINHPVDAEGQLHVTESLEEVVDQLVRALEAEKY